MIKPGIYRHYKGGLCRALFVAQDSTNDAHANYVTNYVVHIWLTGQFAGNVYVRELRQWEEEVSWSGGAVAARFHYVGDHGVALDPRDKGWSYHETLRIFE